MRRGPLVIPAIHDIDHDNRPQGHGVEGEGDGLVDHRKSHEVQEDDGTHRTHGIEGIVIAVHVGWLCWGWGSGTWMYVYRNLYIHLGDDFYVDFMGWDWGLGSRHPRELRVRRLNIVEGVLFDREALAKPRTALFVPREDGVDTTRGGKGAIRIPLTGDTASVLQGPPGPYVTDLRKHLGQGRETGQPRETEPRVRSHEEPCQKGNIHLNVYVYLFYLMGG